MKLGFAGDIHTHEFKDFSRLINVKWDKKSMSYVENPEGKPVNSRLIDVLSTLTQIRDDCIDKGITVVGIAGDLFHQRGSVSTIVYNYTYRVLESFKKLGILVLLEAGNHDQQSNEDVPENSIFALKSICRIISKAEVIPIKDEETGEEVDILCVPFSKNKELMLSKIIEFQPRENVPCILMTHLGLSGAVTGKRSYVMQDTFSIDELLPEKFKYIVLGHYHKPQCISGVNNAFYTGAPLQHNFNDEGEDRGYWVVDTNKRFDMRLVPVVSPKFVTLTADNYKNYDPENNKDFVKIQASKDKEVVSICDDLHSKVGAMDTDVKIEVVKEYKQQSRSGIKVGMSYVDIIKQYASENKEVDGAEEVGLKILQMAMTES